MKRMCIHICTKDRPTELAMLLQSLRNQTFKDFDIFILEDQSGTPLTNYHFINCILTRLRLEGHKVMLVKTEFHHGVSKARQRCVDETISMDYELFARLDDDVVLEKDYIERLLRVLEQGYDLASGVTIPMAGPVFKRESKHLKGIVNRVILDDDGNFVMNGDDCGNGYIDEAILPAHHFRSCAVYYTRIHSEWSVNYTPTKLSKHGFREEQILSFRLLLAGGKIGVDLGAVNHHQQTPSGGERFADQNQLIKQNEEILKEFTKAHKDELNKLFTREDYPTKLELLKENNLAGRI